MKFLIIFAILLMITITPLVYADSITVKPDIGSASASDNCIPDNCYSPSLAVIDSGDKLHFINTDSAAHTITSGSPSSGPSGIFDSGLVISNGDYYTPPIYAPTEYFCMLHPWMTGAVDVVIPSNKWFEEHLKDEPTNITPSNTQTSSVNWQQRYLDVLNDFNKLSNHLGLLESKNTELTMQSAQYRLENQALQEEINEQNLFIENLNQIIQEQVKVIYTWFIESRE